IAVGAFATGRRLETMGIIGQFVSFLILRTDLSGDPVFSDLLGEVRNMVLQTYEHQEVPPPGGPALVVRAVSIVMNHLNRQPGAESAPPLAGSLQMTAAPLSVAAPTIRFDLNVASWRSDEGITLHVEYNAERFERGTIERLCQRFQALL